MVLGASPWSHRQTRHLRHLIIQGIRVSSGPTRDDGDGIICRYAKTVFTYRLGRGRVQLQTLAKARLSEPAAAPDELQGVVAGPAKGGALGAGGFLLIAFAPPPTALVAPLPGSFTGHSIVLVVVVVVGIRAQSSGFADGGKCRTSHRGVDSGGWPSCKSLMLMMLRHIRLGRLSCRSRGLGFVVEMTRVRFVPLFDLFIASR